MRRPPQLKRSATGSQWSQGLSGEEGLSTAAGSGIATAMTSNDEGGFVEVDASNTSTAGVSQNEAQTVKLVVREHAQLCKALTEWMAQQRKTVETQLREQERLINTVVQSHQQTIQGLERLSKDREGVQASGTHLPATILKGGIPAVGDLDHEPGDSEAPFSKDDGPAAATTMADLQDVFNGDEVLLDNWRRCSGLHTVDKWVLNYRKHPAGWGALLMIQGIPEVTARLRNKVENYAIYSALFLSVSIGLITSPPSALSGEIDANQWSGDWWESHLRRRIYIYSLGIGIAFHMLSIMLAMAFCNALNETARDSDVFRMFSRGKGFYATVRTQVSFIVGCVSDVLAMMAAVTFYITWVEVLVGCAALFIITWIVLKKTKRMLFINGSIVQYWREELGGKPDANDPYDLQVPADCFRRRAEASQTLSKITEVSPEAQRPNGGEQRGRGRAGRASVAARAGVAAIF